VSWYQKSIDEVLTLLSTRLDGLSTEEAGKRLSEHGPNVIEKGKKRSAFAILAGQFTDFMILLLIAAAIISAALGETIDAAAILVILLLNAGIGFFQEYRAERALEALSRLATQEAVVIRDGKPRKIDTRLIVPGDIIILEAGQIVPADVRLIEAVSLRVNEAVLTGESYAAEKRTEPQEGANLPLGDQSCLAFKGTAIVYGRGKGVVFATGNQTELGKIASLLRETEEEKTPLQKRLAVFGRQLSFAALVICAIVFGIGVARGNEPLEMFIIAVSIAVAAVPEALPAVISITLALGARTMAKANALIRHLPAVETLGSVTYICTDKTGTLTLNTMTVERVHVFSDDLENAERMIFLAMALNNDAIIDATGRPAGDPMEVALRLAAEEHGVKEDIVAAYPRVFEIPFDSTRKRMTTVHRTPEGRMLVVVKGSYEALRSLAGSVYGTTEEADAVFRDVDAEIEQAAADGKRTIAFGIKELEEEAYAMCTPEEVERNLSFLGFASLIDPLRPEAGDAVREAREAGIAVAMITGDHPLTAARIAREAGILDSGKVITGQELAAMPLDAFEEEVENVRVYARVDPAQKLKIVTALQDRGHIVAMTGDGVNDAPALKKADIGIAMGITGSDVAKESARMVLLDDNFATIVRAVREGRRIYDNIRKFVRYTLGSNSGEIITVLVGPLLGLPLALKAIHILWINLVTDSLPGIALAAERAEPDVMKRPPRHPQESIFARGLGIHVIWVGLVMGAITLFAQWFSIRNGWEGWQTIAFSVLCISQMGHAFAIRSERQSTFSIGFLSNRPLLFAVALTVVLQLALIYVPFFHPIFKTQALPADQLAFVFALSTVVFFAVEVEKFLIRRLNLYKMPKVEVKFEEREVPGAVRFPGE
jgi:Ca2+-transporting ATPase